MMELEEKIKLDFGRIADKFVRQIFTDKTEEELQDVAENYRQYLDVVWDIAGRLEQGHS